MYITGTRADYGLMRTTLRAIDQHPKLRLTLLVTGMHLLEEFGNTVRDVEKDGFEISHRVDMLEPEDTTAAMARSIGTAILGMVESFQTSRPDIVFLDGDRGESLAAAIAAAHMNIPVAHSSGGDVTGTMIDESIRHAITKFAHIHFAETERSANRILSMGEDPWRIHVVGTPGTNLKAELDMPREELAQTLGLDLSRRILLVLQHPVTTKVDAAPLHMRETMEAVVSLQEQTVVIYPNADAGGRGMIKVINGYRHLPHLRTFKSLPRRAYAGLLSVASVMIGNSSSALTEAPSLSLPAINVGTRQQGRDRGGNLIDVDYSREEIERAVRFVFDHMEDPEFVAKCGQSPYQDIDSSEKITDVLSTVELGPSLVQKRFYDGDFHPAAQESA